MKAIFRNNSGDYKITLNRKEAETLAYNYTSYSILLAALRAWPDGDNFDICGSKTRVESDLAKAEKN